MLVSTLRCPLKLGAFSIVIGWGRATGKEGENEASSFNQWGDDATTSGQVPGCLTVHLFLIPGGLPRNKKRGSCLSSPFCLAQTFHPCFHPCLYFDVGPWSRYPSVSQFSIPQPSRPFELFSLSIAFSRHMEVVGVIASFIAIGQVLAAVPSIVDAVKSIPAAKNELIALSNEVILHSSQTFLMLMKHSSKFFGRPTQTSRRCWRRLPNSSMVHPKSRQMGPFSSTRLFYGRQRRSSYLWCPSYKASSMPLSPERMILATRNRGVGGGFAIGKRSRKSLNGSRTFDSVFKMQWLRFLCDIICKPPLFSPPFNISKARSACVWG